MTHLLSNTDRFPCSVRFSICGGHPTYLRPADMKCKSATAASLVSITYFLQIEEIREATMECSDARVKAISEALTGIKAIKLYAWEGPWSERISGLRDAELQQVKRAALLNIAASMLWLAVGHCPSVPSKAS